VLDADDKCADEKESGEDKDGGWWVKFGMLKPQKSPFRLL
jgi:hypothetical protein